MVKFEETFDKRTLANLRQMKEEEGNRRLVRTDPNEAGRTAIKDENGPSPT